MRCAIGARGSPSYSLKPSIWPPYFVFRVSIRILAVGPDEAGVLTGDQQRVGDDVHAPVLDLGEGRTEAEQLVFDEERDDLGQANSLFLPVGEPSHVLALDQRLAGGGLDVAQHAGGMADQRDWLTGGEEGLDQLDRVRIFGQVPYGAWPPG